MKENWKKYLAECVGTAALTFVACGVALVGDYFSTALAFGLVVFVMAFAIGGVSGCHINPAVSLAMFLRKQMSLKDFGLYVASQFVGGIVGTFLLAVFTRFNFEILGGNEINVFLLPNSIDNPDFGSYIGAFFIEVVLTFAFVMAVLNATDKRYHDGKFAPVFIGLSLTLVHLIGIGFTGTSVNPARSFAPALFQAFSGNTTSLSQVWIWLLAPMAGACLAAYLYTFLTKGKESSEEAE